MASSATLAAALAALAPVVVHDADERHPLAAVGPVGSPPAVHARVAPRPDGGAWLQFWLWYRENTQDRGIVRTGRHAGDWEMVQVRVDAAGRPLEAVFAQHHVAERCGWADVRRQGGRPVVYVAHASHASYPRPGTRDRAWPEPNDEAAVVRPRVVRVTERSPGWMRDPRPWGGARAAWWNPAEQSSPRGPAFQGQGRWSDPDGWAAAARPCAPECDRLDACDGVEDLQRAVAGTVALAIAAAGAALLGRRRRRRAA
ncbi:MAG TPA: Vps62-related protein [Capillimicrobium sp.]|jgi:hypothetical protein